MLIKFTVYKITCVAYFFPLFIHCLLTTLCSQHCISLYFLTVQNSSIGNLVTHWVGQWVSEWVTLILTLQSDPRDFWPLRHLIRVMRHDLTRKKDKDKDKQKEQWLTCDIWDTDYNWDNWEPEFMTIFVTWQLRVTLDSIRNSCDVFIM